MSFSTILFEKRDNVGVVTLNRPDRMNAVIEEMYDELYLLFEYISKDRSLRAVMIKGAPNLKNNQIKYSFCAGADLKAHKEGKRSSSEKRKYIKKAHKVNRMIYEFPKPVISCLNGPARGAGAELAICSDFMIMAEEATIGFPETGLGTFVGGGSTFILPRMIGTVLAKKLIYTGEILNGRLAVEYGIAILSFPMDIVIDRSLAFAAQLSSKAPESMSHAKRLINKTWDLKYEDSSDLEADAILSCMDTCDWQEGIDAFNEKRKPVFKGE